jgi:DNA-binding PadR family transcriptional regulator
MPRETKTRYALLGMLSYTPMSGYDMKKMSDHSIGHFWNENFGNIYPVLKKLEEGGLVSMVREDPSDGPSKKVYTITGRGRGELERWLRKPPEPMVLREELLLQVFYGHWVEKKVILDKVRAELGRVEQIIEVLKAIRKHMKNGDNIREAPPEARFIMEEGTPYWQATVEYGLHYYKGIRKWCRQTIRKLAGDEPDQTEEEEK